MVLEETLERYFKLSNFRNNQEAIIHAVLERKDVLVVMPTGGGKSLCYQLPSLLLDGVTVVVSPLISLMQDQVEGLERLGIAVTLINSTLSVKEVNERFENIYKGVYKLIYIAPERFRSGRFVDALKRVKVSLFAIDEAHCISQWGHDFRPDYLWLGAAIENVGRPPIIALTATATPVVQEDIVKSLKLKEPERFVSGFSRPNLELRVINADKDAEKYGHLGKLIESQKKGIIYCATRKRVEKVAATIAKWDCSLVTYHAGMSDEERKRAQNKFMQGTVDIVVATNAFGMGIDRSDIRFVAHFEIPGSLEAYYQEVGRAGRDGLPSVCELYYSYADKRIQEFFIEGSNPTKEMIKNVYQQLGRLANIDNEIHLSIEDIAEYVGDGKNSMAVGTSLSVLSRAGVIERFDVAHTRIKGTRLLMPDLNPNQLPVDYSGLLEKERRDREKLETVIRFATSVGCRQQWILGYFGEADAEICEKCDHCKQVDNTARREPLPEELIIVQKALSGVARMSFKNMSGNWQ
ncbi:MAG: recombinase RecQ, partial [Verrucomicrobia bacterium]